MNELTGRSTPPNYLKVAPAPTQPSADVEPAEDDGQRHEAVGTHYEVKDQPHGLRREADEEPRSVLLVLYERGQNPTPLR